MRLLGILIWWRRRVRGRGSSRWGSMWRRLRWIIRRRGGSWSRCWSIRCGRGSWGAWMIFRFRGGWSCLREMCLCRPNCPILRNNSHSTSKSTTPSKTVSHKEICPHYLPREIYPPSIQTTLRNITNSSRTFPRLGNGFKRRRGEWCRLLEFLGVYNRRRSKTYGSSSNSSRIIMGWCTAPVRRLWVEEWTSN
jgi:hypothetical protein